jgi:hypothetical protein
MARTVGFEHSRKPTSSLPLSRKLNIVNNNSSSSSVMGSLSEEHKEQGQEEADDDACHEGKVKGERIPLDIDIARQPPDPGDFVAEDQDQPYYHKDYAKDNEDFS